MDSLKSYQLPIKTFYEFLDKSEITVDSFNVQGYITSIILSHNTITDVCESTIRRYSRLRYTKWKEQVQRDGHRRTLTFRAI